VFIALASSKGSADRFRKFKDEAVVIHKSPLKILIN
jgi:hypothetical protein